MSIQHRPLLFVLLGFIVAGCFSERSATAPMGDLCNQQLGPGGPDSALVVIRGFAFGPEDVTVQAGGRVTWLNCAEDPHTSTADGGQWDSPLLVRGDAFTQTFDAVGEYPYHCQPHPFMTGRVVVE